MTSSTDLARDYRENEARQPTAEEAEALIAWLAEKPTTTTN